MQALKDGLKLRKKNTIIIIFGVLIIVQLISSIGYGESLEEQEYLLPESYDYYSFQIPLNDPSKTYTIEFESDKFLNLYILNDEQFIDYKNNQNFEFIFNYSEIETLRKKITYVEFTTTSGFPIFEIEDETGKLLETKTKFIILIENSNHEIAEYVLNFYQKPPLLEFADKMTNHMVFLFFIGLGILLITESISHKRDDEEVQASILIKFGFGYVVGAISTFSWEFYSWYRVYHPREKILRSLSYEDFPFEAITPSILTFLTIISLGLSILLMSWTVERDLQQRKIPFITTFLVGITGVFILGIILPVILGVVFIIWIIALFLTIANILISYLRIMVSTQGLIRKKTGYIFFGLLIMFTTIPTRLFVSFQYLFNLFGILGMIMLYVGLAKIK